MEKVALWLDEQEKRHREHLERLERVRAGIAISQ